MFQKIILWLVGVANWIKKVLVWALTNAWAFITTEGKTVKDWHLDPLKVIAIALFVFATWLAFIVVQFIDAGKSDAAVGIVAGLVVTVGGFASYLFGQATANDAAIRRDDKGQ